MGYYLCRIGCNNYTLILTECQVKFFKQFQLLPTRRCAFIFRLRLDFDFRLG